MAKNIPVSTAMLIATGTKSGLTLPDAFGRFVISSFLFIPICFLSSSAVVVVASQMLLPDHW
jgi:hypothetical protein